MDTPEQVKARVKELIDQVEFQLSNVKGWVGADEFKSAAIKAKYLTEAAKGLEVFLSENTKI